MGYGEEKGLRIISESLGNALTESERSGIHILLETTSGQGTSLGWRFEHLRDIIDLSENSENLGVCFDTCHVFAAGYDIRNEEAYRQTMEKFDKVIGNNRLKLFHINDSRTELGSRIDRHNHPGKGNIGMKPFSFFLNDPVFTGHPFILETPKEVHNTGIDMDIINLKVLKKLMD
jgi:deoxyribonuclease-4